MGDGSNHKHSISQDGQVIIVPNGNNDSIQLIPLQTTQNNLVSVPHKVNQRADMDNCSSDSLSSVDFEECVDCFPYPGNRKPAGHSGRHRKAPKHAIEHLETEKLSEFATNYDAALPEDDQVLSPEIPLPGVKPNADSFEPFALDWSQPIQQMKEEKALRTQTEPPTNARTLGQKRKRASSNVCVITDRKPKFKSKKSSPGIGNKRHIKEPQKYKTFTDEELLEERDSCDGRVADLKHKHRKGLECPKCIAIRDLQIVNRVIQGRAYRAKMDPESVLVKDLLNGQRQLKTALDIARPKSSRNASVLSNQTNLRKASNEQKLYNTRKLSTSRSTKRTRNASPRRTSPKFETPTKPVVATTITVPSAYEEPTKPETFTSWTVQSHFRPSDVGHFGLPMPISSASSVSSSSTTHSWERAVQQVEENTTEPYSGPIREDFDKNISCAELVYPIKINSIDTAKQNMGPDYGLFGFDEMNDLDITACTNAQ